MQTQADKTVFDYLYPLNFAKKKFDAIGRYFGDEVDRFYNDNNTKKPVFMDDKLNSTLKEEFLSLYFYENYPSWMHPIICVFYSLINIALFLTYCISLAVPRWLYLVLNQIVNGLLDVITASRYLQFDAKNLALKSHFEKFGIDSGKVVNNDLKIVFNSSFFKQEFSEKNNIKDINGLTYKISFLRVFIKKYTLEERKNCILDKTTPQNSDILNLMNRIESKDKKTNESLDEFLIDELYQKAILIPEKNIENDCRKQFELLSVPQKMHSIGYATQEMLRNQDELLVYRIGRLLLLVISSPLILTTYAIHLITELVAHIFMAIKLLSAEIVNAPLKSYRFMTSLCQDQSQTTNIADNIMI